MRKIVRCTLWMAAAIFACGSFIHAQPTGYPAKPVRVVVSAPGGGALDAASSTRNASGVKLGAFLAALKPFPASLQELPEDRVA